MGGGSDDSSNVVAFGEQGPRSLLDGVGTVAICGNENEYLISFQGEYSLVASAIPPDLMLSILLMAPSVSISMAPVEDMSISLQAVSRAVMACAAYRQGDIASTRYMRDAALNLLPSMANEVSIESALAHFLLRMVSVDGKYSRAHTLSLLAYTQFCDLGVIPDSSGRGGHGGGGPSSGGPSGGGSGESNHNRDSSLWWPSLDFRILQHLVVANHDNGVSPQVMNAVSMAGNGRMMLQATSVAHLVKASDLRMLALVRLTLRVHSHPLLDLSLWSPTSESHAASPSMQTALLSLLGIDPLVTTLLSSSFSSSSSSSSSPSFGGGGREALLRITEKFDPLLVQLDRSAGSASVQSFTLYRVLPQIAVIHLTVGNADKGVAMVRTLDSVLASLWEHQPSLLNASLACRMEHSLLGHAICALLAHTNQSLALILRVLSHLGTRVAWAIQSILNISSPLTTTTST